MPNPPSDARSDAPSVRLLSLNTARVAQRLIDGRRTATAIGKQPMAGPLAVLPLGLEGDEQADASVHGGLSKAIYAYPSEHAPFWQTVRAQARAAAPDAPVPPGLLGENLTLAGLTEADAWIGDRLVFPHCTLAVSEPRHPCFKFNAAMGFPHAAKMMVQSGWCGFYLAVIEPGTLAAGESARLEPGPREVNIRELFLATMNRKRTWT